MQNLIYSYNNSHNLKTKKTPEKFSEEFISLFEIKLRKSYIHNIKIEKNEIRFKAPIARFTWNGWNLFNPVSEGMLKINTVNNNPHIRYEFKFTEFFVIAFLMTFSAVVAFSINLIGWGVVMLLVNWLLFFLVSRIIFTVRMSKFITETANTINDVPSPDLSRRFKDEWEFIDFVFISQPARYDKAVG